MKVIDLLNKIANGEEVPKNIKCYGYIFEYDTNHLRYESYFDGRIWTLNDFVNVDDNLNDEVEILEEEKKMPENINLAYIDKEYLLEKEDVDRKINEIINRHNIMVDKVIDYLDYLESKGE